MNRLIDRLQQELQHKNLLGEISCILIKPSSFSELVNDFDEEFQLEYESLGRKPSVEDLEEYLKLRIISNSSEDEEEEYHLLAKV